ncbi:MAG: radical SAM protein [Proteobacteria bacterium]|nr:radical SAM protein [Pseudomonadota bacterium]
MNDQILHFREPALHDKHEDEHLLVWSDLATWMVMDDELLSLLNRFNGGASLGRVIFEHARGWKKPLEQVSSEAEPIIRDFVRRAILTQKPGRLEKAEEPIEIANVTLNLTNRCNLKCSFCYNGRRIKDEISIDKICSFLKNAQTEMSNDASLIVLGGEPTLEPDRLFNLLDNIDGMFSQAPMISTNGTHLNEDIVNELANRRVEVQVSLDSHDPKAHDAGRGTGVFSRATAGIQRLVKAGVHTIISMVYKRSNIRDMEGYLELAMSLGVNEARFIPLRRAGAAKDYQMSEQPDQLVAFEHLLNILEKRPELSRLLRRDFFSIALTQCRYSTSRVSCGIGRRVIFIDADGSLYPCPNHVAPEFLLGSANTDSLNEILLTSKRMCLLRERYHIDNYAKCSKCPFKHWCAGDCRGEVLAITGDPTAASPHCEQLLKMYTRMLWLIAKNDPRLASIPKNPSGKAAKDTFWV